MWTLSYIIILFYCYIIWYIAIAYYYLQNDLLKPEDVNLVDSEGNSAFHLSVLANRIDFVQLLLENKWIDIDLKNNDGYNAYDLAKYNNLIEIQSYLSTFYDPFEYHLITYRNYVTSKYPNAPIEFALKNEDGTTTDYQLGTFNSYTCYYSLTTGQYDYNDPRVDHLTFMAPLRLYDGNYSIEREITYRISEIETLRSKVVEIEHEKIELEEHITQLSQNLTESIYYY